MKQLITYIFQIGIAFLFCSTSCFAQDINGINIWDKVPQKEIVRIFGEPIRYNSYKDDFGKIVEEYEYETMALSTEGEHLFSFSVTNKGLPVFTTLVDGGIQVEDIFDDRVKREIGKHFELMKYQRREKTGVDFYEYYMKKHDDITLTLVVVNGRIGGLYVSCNLF